MPTDAPVFRGVVVFGVPRLSAGPSAHDLSASASPPPKPPRPSSRSSSSAFPSRVSPASLTSMRFSRVLPALCAGTLDTGRSSASATIAAQHRNAQVPHRLSTAHALSDRLNWRIQTRPRRDRKSDAGWHSRLAGALLENNTVQGGVRANVGSNTASGRVSKDRR